MGLGSFFLKTVFAVGLFFGILYYFGVFDLMALNSDDRELHNAIDYQVNIAKPYLDEVVYSDASLAKMGEGIVSKCGSSDLACQVNAVFRYVVENYPYSYDPSESEYIRTPFQTIADKTGDCEDLSILINSILENIHIKTYLVLSETHAYSLVCGIDTIKLSEYVKNDLKRLSGFDNLGLNGASFDVSSYTIDGQKCIVLDATTGVYGYPGLNPEGIGGGSIAFNSKTKEIVSLK